MQEALDLLKTARGNGRHGCLARRRLTIVEDDGKVLGTQQTIQFG